MPSYTNISWLVSFTDHAGTRHHITSDGLPPGHGYPPPPSHEQMVIPPPAGLAAVLYGSPPPVPQPTPVASYTFRPPGTLTTQFVNIRFISNGVRPHRDRFTGRNRDEDIRYTICRAATSMKMNDLIKAFDGSGARGFTECKLLSDGYTWAEVRTFKLDDDSSAKTLAEIGWTESRGVDGPPVWVSAFHEGLDGEEEKIFWRGLGFVAS